MPKIRISASEIIDLTKESEIETEDLEDMMEALEGSTWIESDTIGMDSRIDSCSPKGIEADGVEIEMLVDGEWVLIFDCGERVETE